MKLEAATHTVAQTATITFDREELEFLGAIMNKIGGSPTGIRRHSYKLDKILANLGYTWDYIKETEAYIKARDGEYIHFED
jgi:hypothetical protein